jgi:Ca2+/Na+ antiporter
VLSSGRDVAVARSATAVRLGAVTMAYSNIFGANILDTAILFLADAVYRATWPCR